MLGSRPTFATPWCGGGGQKVRHSRHNLTTLDDAKQQHNDMRKSCGGQKFGRGPNTRLGLCGGHSCGVVGYDSKPNSPCAHFFQEKGSYWWQLLCPWPNLRVQTFFSFFFENGHGKL
jgi:hypothetical protein